MSGKYDSRPSFPKRDARRFFYRYYGTPGWEKAASVVSELRCISEELGVPTAQVALAWLLAESRITSVLVGTRTIEQALVNAGGADVELSHDQFRRLDAVSLP